MSIAALVVFKPAALIIETVMTSNRKATISDENREESRLLKALWESTGHAGLTQEAFGHKYEIGSQAAVGFFLNGKSALSMKAARGFAQGLRCKISDFSKRLAEEANQLSALSDMAPGREKVIEISSHNRQKNKPHELVIPQFDAGGSMGGGLVLRDQPGVIQSWNVSEEWVEKNIKSHTGSQNLCIVTGFGDSMKGMFNSGDPLVIDKGITSVDFDAVYFFRVEEEGFIKRLQRIPGEGVRVLSENKKYDSWTIKPGMDFQVFGRVVKAWQGEDF